MSSPPSADEIALCVSIMNRIPPADLLFSRNRNLLEAGHVLFGRSIKMSIFGEKDVVDFFRQKEDYKSLLRRLERVHDEVQRAHANFVEVITIDFIFGNYHC